MTTDTSNAKLAPEAAESAADSSTTATTRPASVDISLDVPIKRGNQVINSITLRRPKAGELRGIALLDLAQLDFTALQKLLPRISSPTLTTHDVAAMDPADLVEAGAKVVGFLTRQEALADLPTA